jgi:hypothetical protein
MEALMRIILALLTLMLATGCSISSKLKKLDEEEYGHYMALRVYMDQPDGSGKRAKTERKEFFKLKTRAERDQWLKAKGHWDRFYQYAPHIQQKIIDGQVQVGWDKHMIYMAWGRPFLRRKLPGRQAQRSEMFIYRFEELQDHSHQVWVKGSKDTYKAARLYVKELIVDDDKLAEIREKEGGW